MEPHRSAASRPQRKPLGDITNTISRTPHHPPSSSSSVVKFANPSLTSSLKRLIDQTSLKEKTQEDVNISSKVVAGAGTVSKSVRPVTRRMSADLGFPASAPPQPRSGVGDKDFTQPYSVYTVRRKASGRKRNKVVSSSSAMPRLRLDLISTPGKRKHQADDDKTKPSKVPPKKRQRTVKKQKEDKVDQDYIEKQKAYFAEIDAFELQEEEVSSSDLD